MGKHSASSVKASSRQRVSRAAKERPDRSRKAAGGSDPGSVPITAKRNTERSARAEALMSAALDLFAERNFASVTIKDIANVAGVNTALIYYYFNNKTDLFQKTIENAVANAFAGIERVADDPDDPDDPATLITSWLDNHLSLYDPIHKLVKVSLDYKGAPDKVAAIDEAIQYFYDHERELLSGAIRAGVEQGIFKPVDPDKIAQYISTYLDGAMVRAVILPDFDLAGAVGDLRETTWELLGYKRRR